MARNPNPIDVHVGKRLRQARKHAGVGYFFEGLPDNISDEFAGSELPLDAALDVPDDQVRTELPELIDGYYIHPRPVRDAIKALVKAISRADV